MAQTLVGAWREISQEDILQVMYGQYDSAAALARALGISDRGAQRWFTEGTEKRSPSKKNLDKMRKLIPALHVRITGLFLWDTPRDSKRAPDRRARDIEFDVEDQFIEPFIAALMAGDEEAAQSIALEAYGIVEDQPSIPNGVFEMEPLGV